MCERVLEEPVRRPSEGEQHEHHVVARPHAPAPEVARDDRRLARPAAAPLLGYERRVAGRARGRPDAGELVRVDAQQTAEGVAALVAEAPHRVLVDERDALAEVVERSDVARVHLGRVPRLADQRRVFVGDRDHVEQALELERLEIGARHRLDGFVEVLRAGGRDRRHVNARSATGLARRSSCGAPRSRRGRSRRPPSRG